MTSLSTYSPRYFTATPFKNGTPRYTNETTKQPIAIQDPFYQEQQDSGKCSIHSINAFAGRMVVNLQEFCALNNAVQEQAFSEMGVLAEGVEKIDALKQSGVYLETLEDFEKNGVSPLVIKKYIETYNQKFDLPKDSFMTVVEGRYQDTIVQKEIKAIEQNPRLHRIILGTRGAHYLTIRKDKQKSWHVIDSQTRSHKIFFYENETDKIQPPFLFLREAVAWVNNRYNTQSCIIIRPTEENSTNSRMIYTAVTAAVLAAVTILYSAM